MHQNEEKCESFSSFYFIFIPLILPCQTKFIQLKYLSTDYSTCSLDFFLALPDCAAERERNFFVLLSKDESLIVISLIDLNFFPFHDFSLSFIGDFLIVLVLWSLFFISEFLFLSIDVKYRSSTQTHIQFTQETIALLLAMPKTIFFFYLFLFDDVVDGK